jgi:hypothetical protein
MARFDQQRDRPDDRIKVTADRSEAPPGRDLRAGRQRFARSACRGPAGDVPQAIRSIVASGCQALAPNAVADLFNWATATDEYEITQSPLGYLESRGLIGTRVVRQRVLT